MINYFIIEHYKIARWTAFRLFYKNLVIKKNDSELIIKIIDGLGSKAFIPLPEYSNFFAKRYVHRRIQLMWSRINWDLSGRKGDWK